jgi:thiol-disulfide isomerase/thioredoxin
VIVLALVAPATAQKLIYPPADAAADIAAAVATAKNDGKHVLIDFGADWCPDCRVLATLFDDPAVAPIVEQNFHVVHVDIGRRDKNADVVAKYQATSDAWIPAVVILDGSATVLAATDDKVRLTRRTTALELAETLNRWAPKKLFAELASFREHGIDVALRLERDSAGKFWLAGRFAPAESDVHLYDTDLPRDGVDGLGRPTTLRIGSTEGLRPRGAVFADRRVELDRIEQLNETLSVYPAGPVTLRMPVELPRRGESTRAEVLVTYMGCGGNGCLPPVIDRRVAVVVPTADGVTGRSRT